MRTVKPCYLTVDSIRLMFIRVHVSLRNLSHESTCKIVFFFSFFFYPFISQLLANCERKHAVGIVGGKWKWTLCRCALVCYNMNFITSAGIIKFVMFMSNRLVSMLRSNIVFGRFYGRKLNQSSKILDIFKHIHFSRIRQLEANQIKKNIRSDKFLTWDAVAVNDRRNDFLHEINKFQNLSILIHLNDISGFSEF